MIFPLSGILFGAIVGALAARRRGGNRLDMAQWGAAGAIMLGLVGLFVLILVGRALGA